MVDYTRIHVQYVMHTASQPLCANSALHIDTHYSIISVSVSVFCTVHQFANRLSLSLRAATRIYTLHTYVRSYSG